MQRNENIFGTDGIRGPFGFGVFTHTNLVRLTHALALWLVEKKITEPVLLGRDTRASGKIIATVLKHVLAQHGICCIDGGVLPTPLVSFTLKHAQSFGTGIMITASHNPAMDNGLKILDSFGSKISLQDEVRISRLYYSQPEQNFELQSEVVCINQTTHNQYVNAYTAALHTFFVGLDLAGMTLCVDTANGALSHIAKPVLESFGAHVILECAMPSGTNINQQCGAAYATWHERFREHTNVLKCSFDGDGDRLGVVDTTGCELNGDDLLWVLSHLETYAHNSCYVGTIMSNGALEKACAAREKEFARSQVGDKYVVEMLIQNNALLGAEPSGHVILLDKNPISDGLMVLLAYLYAQQVCQGLKPLLKYAQKHARIPFEKSRLGEVKEICARALNDVPVDGARLVVRPSGTEPIVRVMVEHQDAGCAEMVLARVRTWLIEKIS